MKLKNIEPYKKIITTSSDNKWLDPHNSISDNIWERKVIIYIFGIRISKYVTNSKVTNQILDRNGKPLGFTESK